MIIITPRPGSRGRRGPAPCNSNSIDTNNSNSIHTNNSKHMNTNNSNHSDHPHLALRLELLQEAPRGRGVRAARQLHEVHVARPNLIMVILKQCNNM